MKELSFETKDTPESSNVASVGYNKDHEVLRVTFKNGGSYRYYGVDEDIFLSAKNAKSIGNFIHNHVKGKFDSFKEV